MFFMLKDKKFRLKLLKNFQRPKNWIENFSENLKKNYSWVIFNFYWIITKDLLTLFTLDRMKGYGTKKLVKPYKLVVTYRLLNLYNSYAFLTVFDS